MKNYIILTGITLIGGLLRFVDLGTNPLWIDESLLAHWAYEGKYHQEFITMLIADAFNTTSEYWLRFPTALAGTLTIPAIFFAVKKYKLQSALIVAIFPLFVFWSRLGRPYAFAGLFLVLGWRWWWFSILSIVSTPFGLIGIKFWKEKKWITAALFLLAIIVFLNRPDTGADKPIFIYRTRLFYIPVLTLLLYVVNYDWGFKFYKAVSLRLMIFTGLIIVSLTFLPAHQYRQWYSYEVGFSDWRGHQAYNFSTNAHLNYWYSGCKDMCMEIKPKFVPLMIKTIREGNTITIGMDYYALETPSKEILPPELVAMFKDTLLAGKVVGIAMNQKEVWRIK